MTYVEKTERPAPPSALPTGMRSNAVAVCNHESACLPGYGPEDSWATLVFARYRKYTNNKFGLRLCNSEPDLLHRRQPDFAPTHKNRRRASSLDAPGAPPASRAVRNPPPYGPLPQVSEGPT